MDVISIAKRNVNNKRDFINFVSIRNSEPKDDSILGDLLVSVFSRVNQEKVGVSMTKERMTELQKTTDRRIESLVRILEFGSQIIGSYTLSFPGSSHYLSWNSNDCYFSTFAILPEYHGLELGPLLLLDAQSIALSQSIPSISILVEKDAHKLHNFYQKQGFYFDPSGNQKHVGMNLLGMRANLSFSTTNDLLKAI